MNTLVTGSATGFGRLIVELLAAEGHTVFATMRGTEGRNAETAAALRGLPGVSVLELDVTSDDSVRSAVQQVLAAAGHIDCLVNNAGVASIGVAEGFTIDQWQAVFNTNLLGCIRMNSAVLPSMRARRSGLLIHIASIAGRLAAAYMGPYGPSKWALECYAEMLRLELAPLGVDSVVVEPGKYRTEIIAKADESARASGISREYGPADLAGRFMDWFMADMDRLGQDPREVAEKVRDLMGMPFGARPFRTLAGQDAAGLQGYNDYADAIRGSLPELTGLHELMQTPQKQRDEATA